MDAEVRSGLPPPHPPAVPTPPGRKERPMLQSLLVPLDGSEFSERTLGVAQHLAKATGASLHLAHVHVPHPPDHFLSNTQFHYEGLDLEEYETRHRDQELA